MNTKATTIFVILAAMALLSIAREAEAACNPLSLTPCAGSIISSSPPSTACCNALNQQRPCLCQYSKDPNLSQYVNSPGAKQVASTCHVTVKC